MREGGREGGREGKREVGSQVFLCTCVEYVGCTGAPGLCLEAPV